MTTLRGELRLEFDDPALQARVTVVPREDGSELSPDSVVAALKKKNVRAAVDADAVERAFRTLGRKRDETVSFVAASGTAPLPPEAEAVSFEELPIPQRLAAIAPRVLA